MPRVVSCALLPLLLGAPLPAAGQPLPVDLGIGAQAIGLVRRVDPAFGGRAKTEGYLAQPALMAHAAAGMHLSALLTLDLEGLTLKRGELSPGIWGEGYIDRRHPHTYLHEAIGVVAARALGARWSLSGGKGFAPFGTDDPMTRPFVAFPVNHHLAQILERAVLIAALRAGPLGLEGGVFNGDEPEGPGDAPDARRFADSWSARATLAPRPSVELQLSRAAVQSPEWAQGFGADQRKWSASARYERAAPSEPRGDHAMPEMAGMSAGSAAADAREYALVEWARTEDVFGGVPAFRYRSVLAESALRRRGIELALRWESTERPEEERLLDPFRSARPHSDESILGVTRWHIATVAVSAPAAWPLPAARTADIRPFVEVARLRPVDVTGRNAFVASAFFGGDVLWSFSAGLRLSAGTLHPRMGRYGAAAGPHPGDR